MKALLLGAAGIGDYEQLKGQLSEDYDYVLCVDGGIRHLEPLGLTPDLIIGDMDSADPEALKALQSVPVKRFPVMKDESDSELALLELGDSEYEVIHMVGFYGSRWDHTLVNFGLLIKYAHLNVHMIDENNRAFAGRGRIELQGLQDRVVSLIPMTPIFGVTLTGMKYPLNDVDVAYPTSLTLSNSLVDSRGSIEVREGKYIVVISMAAQ
ncbi:MAG: hypothetical protein AVO33_02850 [delta proteobacterium ML8_F1]|nr:MAG: hypothetical protein AVO33_02850 [delta proteobacterium ML8_F1]